MVECFPSIGKTLGSISGPVYAAFVIYRRTDFHESSFKEASMVITILCLDSARFLTTTQIVSGP